MLPSINVSLPILFLLWCGASVWAMGSAVMLAYPLMWAAVAALFFVASKALGEAPAADGGAS